MIYQDKETKKWKVGKNGKAIYDSEKEANKAALVSIINRLWDLQQKRNKAVSNNG